MQNTKFFMLFSCLVVLASLSLTACNTVEGVGKDVESAGESVQEAAD